MIKEHTDDFIAQVTEEIEIEKHFHGDIIGKGGKQVQEVKISHETFYRVTHLSVTYQVLHSNQYIPMCIE